MASSTCEVGRDPLRSASFDATPFAGDQSKRARMTSILGVPLMDRDHAALERMFEDAARTADEGLPEFFEAIARELADHFAREEAAMTEARVPGLLPHLELHAQLLREVEKMREAIASGDAAAREILEAILPQLIEHHVATADTVSASSFRG